MAVDRAALQEFFTGSRTVGAYPDTLYGRVERWRRELLAECRDRKVEVHLTGVKEKQTHAPVATPLADVAAQLTERWPDPDRTDGRSWTLSQSVEQVALCCVALDATDRAGETQAPEKPAPAPTPPTGGWKALRVMTAASATGERSSFQSAVPTWGGDGMHVSLLARGDRSGTPNPTSGSATQRCEVHLAGWGGLSGRQFLRYDFTLGAGFPVDTTTWQAIAQLKNSSTGSPPLEIMVGRGEVYLQWHDKGGSETGREVLGRGTPGARHSVVLDVTFASSGRPSVSGWMNGRQAFGPVSHGPTMYPGQSIYGKLGLYRNNSIGRAADVTFHGVARGSTLASVTT